MDRRQFLSLSSLGAAAVLLTACSGPSLGGGTGASTAPVGGPDFTGVTPAKKITFWSNHPGSSQDVTQQIIQAFTAKTGIEVELVTAGKNYEEVAQKFQTAQQGGGR